MKPVALDIHTHLIPVNKEALAAMDGVQCDAAALTIDGHKVGVKALYAPDALIAWLDDNAIGGAWISAPPPLYRQRLLETAAAAWVHYVNEGLAAIAQCHPGRLTALPHLPIEHPDLAADVARRAIAAGQKRFSAPSGGQGCTLSDAAYAPLWRTLDAASAFVLVHPGETDDRRLGAFYLANLLGNPCETTVAIAHLVFGGVVQHYPNIVFCFAHGGGAAPMLAGRFEQGFRTDRPDVDTSLPSPRTMMKRLMVDCIAHDTQALRLAEAVFGSDHILFGSDWPFPMGLMQPHRQLAELKPGERKRIFQDNSARLVA